MRNRKPNGYSMVEVMVTAAILGMVALAAAESLRSIYKFTGRTKDARNRDRIVGSLVQNVTENISNLQKSYDPDSKVKEALLSPEKLPMAWDQSKVVSAELCPSCPGRVGFYIEALPSTRGLSRLTVRITHRTLIQGYQDYVYIVSDD